MASPPLNPNPSSKSLNPNATPFTKPLLPPKIELVLPLKQFLPHNLSQAMAHSTPLVAHGLIGSKDSVPAPAWGYPAPATIVYYNLNKQPFTANSMPFYTGHLDKPVSYNTNAQSVVGIPSSYYPITEHQKGFAAATMEERVKGLRDFGVFGCRGQRADNRYSRRHSAPRMRSKKRDTRDSCPERLWVPKKLSLEENTGGAGSGRELDKKGDGDDDGLGACSSLSHNEIEHDGKTSLMIRNIPNQFG